LKAAAKSCRGQVRSHDNLGTPTCGSAPGRDIFWGRDPELARHLEDRGEKLSRPGGPTCGSAPGRDMSWGRALELARHLEDRGEKLSRPGPLPQRPRRPSLWERTWARHLLRPCPGAGAPPWRPKRRAVAARSAPTTASAPSCGSAPERDIFWGRARELARHLEDRSEKLSRPGPLPQRPRRPSLWERTWARHLLRPWPGAGAPPWRPKRKAVAARSAPTTASAPSCGSAPGRDIFW